MTWEPFLPAPPCPPPRRDARAPGEGKAPARTFAQRARARKMAGGATRARTTPRHICAQKRERSKTPSVGFLFRRKPVTSWSRKNLRRRIWSESVSPSRRSRKPRLRMKVEKKFSVWSRPREKMRPLRSLCNQPTKVGVH